MMTQDLLRADAAGAADNHGDDDADNDADDVADYDDDADDGADYDNDAEHGLMAIVMAFRMLSQTIRLQIM